MMLAGSVLDWILLVVAVLASVPFLILGCEAIASLLPSRRRKLSDERPACVVVIPAHNETGGIAATIINVRDQLATGDRILVVADNCTDSTASIARETGADVVERFDESHRGKGYALDAGIRTLIANPPAIVVIVDADCELGPGALDALVRQAHTINRPAQGVYLIGTGKEADVRQRLSAFAVLFKNKIRPSGLDRLGLPCLLTGTGMAFPWHVLQLVRLGTGNIVEDMKLGVDLALAGHPARLCQQALLSGAAAPDRRSTIKQRTRWEHGHVQTLLNFAPRLLLAGVCRGRAALIGLGLELSVPPLSLACLGWLVTTLVCLLFWHFLDASRAATVVLGCSGLFVGLSIFAAWLKFGRTMLPFTSLLQAPVYILWKIPIYVKLAIARERNWERTDRTPAQK